MKNHRGLIVVQGEEQHPKLQLINTDEVAVMSSRPSTPGSSTFTSPIGSPTPNRARQSLPAHAHNSPLRAGSPPPLPSARRVSLTTPLKPPSTPPPPNKARARDLLRKHYGLAVGPPPPISRSDSGGTSNDPMDLGEWDMIANRPVRESLMFLLQIHQFLTRGLTMSN